MTNGSLLNGAPWFRRDLHRVPAAWGLRRADGETVTLARRLVGLSQAELALAIAARVSHVMRFQKPHLSMIENNAAYLSEEFAGVIAACLNAQLLVGDPALTRRHARLGLRVRAFSARQFLQLDDATNDPRESRDSRVPRSASNQRKGARAS